MSCYSDTTLREKLATDDPRAKEGRSDESRCSLSDGELWRGLLSVAQIEHADDRDMNPVFEVRFPCMWTVKSFKDAIIKSLQEGLTSDDVG